jgi:hypothetical protein
MSYGVPDENGKPMLQTAIIDGQTISGAEQASADEVAIAQGLYMCHREYKMLQHAVTHYVSAEVLDLVTEAAELAENEPLFHTDLPTPNGFAVFERPIVFPDLDPLSGKPHPTIKVYVRAMGWCMETRMKSLKTGDVGPGVSVFLYTSKDDYADGYERTMREAGYQPNVVAEEVVDGNFGLIQFEVMPWRFGAEWGGRDEIAYTPGTVPQPIAQQRRWFFTFMRFMWQTIIMRHAVTPDRAHRRRWERAGMKADFTVLRLRRIEDPFYRSDGTGVGLDKRVKVRGHWRRQYFPSLGHARNADGTMNPESHRLVWIDQHWRGPEDAPLGAMHSATSVVR